MLALTMAEALGEARALTIMRNKIVGNHRETVQTIDMNRSMYT